MHSSEQELLAMATEWFHHRGWQPHEFQTKAWEKVLSGEEGLVNAPTGMGKTYSLWVPLALKIFDLLVHQPAKAKGIQVLWITPLRALSKEIARAAEEFALYLHADFKVASRSGDTSSYQKSKQKTKPPHLLITTPETVHILLAQKKYPTYFRNLKAVVVDEWHELLGTKRGVQMELALARFRTINPELQTWGISATIGNLEEALSILMGVGRKGHIIKAREGGKINMHTLIPEEMERYPWSGHLGTKMAKAVIPVIEKSTSTLLFTNTRAQAELWYQKLLDVYPDLAGQVALHHGSLERDIRVWVEEALQQGMLKAVVATSSLDLGVDFSPVETVVQIGSPKGVSRFIQRAGRSNHQPGKASEIYFLPTNAWELLEASALKQAIEEEAIESRMPYVLSFDVLVQYLCTLAVSEGFYPDKIYSEVLHTHAYQYLSKEEYAWCINFLIYGGESLFAYDEYKKIIKEADGKLVLTDRKKARMHRMAMGTIVSDPMLRVKFMSGGFLGMVEEWAVSKLKPGDVFWFAGRALELFKIREMQVLVKKTNKKTGKTLPFMGGRMPLSTEMADYILRKLDAASRGALDSEELESLKPVLETQSNTSTIPRQGELLIEYLQTREGYHVYIYPFQGRGIHESLASLIAFRIGKIKPLSFSLAFNDYGFELLCKEPIPIEETMSSKIFTTEHLLQDLQASMNSTEMAKRKFRDIAVISGLVFQGLPENKIPFKHLQSSSSILFEVFRDNDPTNLLYKQAYQETFERNLQEPRLRAVLEKMSSQRIIVNQIQRPTPLCFPIMVDRLREKLSSEKLEDRIRRMTLQLGKDGTGNHKRKHSTRNLRTSSS